MQQIGRTSIPRWQHGYSAARRFYYILHLSSGDSVDIQDDLGLIGFPSLRMWYVSNPLFHFYNDWLSCWVFTYFVPCLLCSWLCWSSWYCSRHWSSSACLITNTSTILWLMNHWVTNGRCWITTKTHLQCLTDFTTVLLVISRITKLVTSLSQTGLLVCT